MGCLLYLYASEKNVLELSNYNGLSLSPDYVNLFFYENISLMIKKLYTFLCLDFSFRLFPHKTPFAKEH